MEVIFMKPIYPTDNSNRDNRSNISPTNKGADSFGKKDLGKQPSQNQQQNKNLSGNPKKDNLKQHSPGNRNQPAWGHNTGSDTTGKGK